MAQSEKSSYEPDYSVGRPQHMRPSRLPEPDRSAKRQRSEAEDQYQKRDYGRGDSYRSPHPSDAAEKREQDHDAKRRRPEPENQGREIKLGVGGLYRTSHPTRTADQPRRRKNPPHANRNPPNSSHHSHDIPNQNRKLHKELEAFLLDGQKQRDRTSLSAKIHSLRRQLEKTDNMPAVVRDEKERELAGYVVDQEKARIQKHKAKVTTKYHFVRFMERKKADKNLKNLTSQKKRDLDSVESKKLDKLIHEAEVDLAYTQYAPLAAKYLSLFAEDPQKETIARIPKKDQALLTAKQWEEEHVKRDEAINVARNRNGLKPPLWFEVQRLLEDRRGLERLRDSMVEGRQFTVTRVGRKKNGDGRRSENEQRPGRMDNNRAVDPEDLGSESEDGGMNINIQNEEMSSDDDDDEFFSK